MVIVILIWRNLKKRKGNKMSKGKKIAFWIVFPIVSLIISALLIFYFDLANGPIICLILECIFLVSAITVRIILRNKKFIIRAIPTFALILSNLILLPLTKPSVQIKSAAYYDNPTKTEVMHLENGDVIGVYNEDSKVRIYAGIPYAKAPVGDLRWKEPQDVDNWEGVKDCTHFASKSMQPESNQVTSTLVDIYASKGWHPDYSMHPVEPRSEDSLYLNIWRPNTEENNLPILVYIHGGSLTNGSSAFEDYNGEEMAKKGIVFITIQYRLGVFGYFAHDDLIKESPNSTTGNYGLLDQIKALEWVNNNASYFGGDKNNITIAGESAGSSSVSAICASPLASHLFKRAIGESSSVVVKKAPHTFRKMSEALETGTNIMKEFKCSSIEELRKIPAEELVKTEYANSSMTIDGYALEKNPYEVYLENNSNEEALLNGYNVLEADAFVVPQYLFNPTNSKNVKQRLIDVFEEDIGTKIYNLYKADLDKDAFNTFNEIISVYWFIYPHESWTKAAINSGKTVYRYQFTKENNYYGTYHSGEMIYCYGNVKKSPYDYRYDESDEKLSEIMLSYWSNFAKNGNPNGEGLPKWSPYDLSSKSIQELGVHVGPIVDRYEKLYPLIEEYIDYQCSLDENSK